jgi:hypothetical protein
LCELIAKNGQAVQPGDDSALDLDAPYIEVDSVRAKAEQFAASDAGNEE